MEALRRLLGASPARRLPPPVESDDVYPVHMLDDTKTLRSIVVTWTLCFNDVLDTDNLHASLSRLLEIGDWRKVGGRLRLKNGELEIHVPRPFTAERPAVSYTHQSLAMDIEDHPLAKTLPKATEAPSIQSGPQAFRTFAARENAPETLEDFAYTDAPQLSLYITSFNNATLVALSWPHTLMDVMGQQALLHGWSLVLAGRESEVPPMLGAREDAIRAATDAPMEKEEEYSLGQKRLKGWAMAMFGIRFAGDLLRNRVVETRTIFLPKKVVAELQRQAQGDLAAQDDGAEKPFISEGDVLTAWTLRAVVSSLPQPRPVAALHALNARFRLSSLVQASGVYIQNMAVAAFTFVSPEIATGPLGHIALENRRHLMEQSTEPQVLAYLRELRREQKSGSDPASMLYCESNALLMPFTNWTRANFFKTADFSPALVRAGETGQSRSNPPGTMVFHHAQSMRQSPTARNVIVVLGKDHDDNYWLTGTLLPPAWAKIEEDLKRM
ncbi:uncharacterized protein K441DRAFT_208219 [Cenococcum geophilum 1.58]|uniref:uncharacterized protein n=1 Tax=Cenococcum geophilum 1.58 TaxID=794803 RepID=UPI00358F85D9|nr:hypothetical protein K441DRAFT_208219 [Cenococcum geophilum 1.58]